MHERIKQTQHNKHNKHMSEENKASAAAYGLRFGSKPFKVRVMEAEKKTSQNGNLMLPYQVEIIEAEPIKNLDTGENVDVNGLMVYGRQMLMGGKSLNYVNKHRKALGMEPVTEAELSSIDPDSYKGRTGWCLINSSLEERKNEVTGEAIVNPVTGKPLTTVQREIKEWFTAD